MLAGDGTAEAVRFAGETNFLMPAGLAGSECAGKRQGGHFYTPKDSAVYGGASDRIELFRLTPDFTTPANSNFTMVRSLAVARFCLRPVCGSFVCIPQGGTAQKLDAVEQSPMYRFAYRRFADHEALVGSFTVGGGSGGAGAAMRWFELRNTGSEWTLFQEGTQDYPGVDQWMGSIDIDRVGDVALGYSEIEPDGLPELRYAAGPPMTPWAGSSPSAC